MDPKPNQLSGMQAPVPNQLSMPAPGQGPADPRMTDPPAPPPKPRSRLRAFVGSIAGRIVIIGAIVLIGFLFRNYTSGNAGELQVGDCFDPPTGVETITDVQHHPCTDTHGAEVIFVGNYAAANDAPYPANGVIDTYVAGLCSPAFSSYIGTTYETQLELDAAYYFPASDSWTKDHARGLVCYVYRHDGQPATKSYRGAKP